MKNHIVFKFIAILLCAASLMGAVGSALGIVMLTEQGLYSRDVEEAYGSFVETHADALAAEIGQRYASMNLGGANSQLADSIHGSYWSSEFFDFDRVSYQILDEEGNELQSYTMDDAYTPVKYFTFPLGDIRYVRVLSETPEDTYYQDNAPVLPEGVTTQMGDVYVYNAIPENGAEVYFINIQFDDGSGWGVGSPEEPMGFLVQHEDGTVEFLPTEDYGPMEDAEPVSITFLTRDHQCIYEASSPDGILSACSWAENVGFTLLLRNLEPQTMAYDAIPPEGCTVIRVSVTYADDHSMSTGGAPDIGFLDYDEEGRVRFVPSDAGAFTYLDVPVTHIAFYDEQEELVYEARDPEGVGWFTYENGELIFLADSDIGTADTDTPTEETLPEETFVGYVRVNTNIYASTDLSSPVVGFMTTGQTVEIAQQVTDNGLDWGWISGSGWALLDGITLVPAEEPSGYALEPTEELVAELFLAEVQQDLDVYSAPAADSDTVGAYARGDVVSVIEIVTASGATWAQTDLGWIPMEYLVQVELPVMEFDIIPIEETVDPTGETLPYVTEAAIENTIPDETVVEVTVPEEVPILPEDYGLATASELDIYTASYWDYTSQQRMIVEYVLEPMPAYTVEVQLAEGACRYESEWVIARLLYSYRDQLPYLLAVCLLLFAIFAVYLCCAAGKKPGTKEIHAGGLNAMPLELYACIAIGGVAVLCVVGVEGTRYLLRSDIMIGLFCAGLSAYGVSLLIVAFCYACAAQFKTPGGYWWRNSLCGYCLRLAGKLCRWLLKFARWATEKCETRLWPWLVSLCAGIFKVLKVLLKMLGDWLQRLVEWLQRCGDRLGKNLNRFFSMLPLTWQWLLAGGAMIFFLFITVAGRYDTGIVLSILFGVGLVIYGAHCFGSLLESAKRMSSGDLDEKVDDKLMTGSFKEFANELNGLADVAVVAAQKQLKSERMKTELITNVSHDIKTPLTSIINYVDLLQKPHTDAEQAQYLEVLDRQSQRLKKLIDDLMEMSKASTGNLAVDVTKVDAGEAVNQALGEFADKLDKAQLIPVFRQPEEQVLMMADGRLVWRVMSNLLSNAVKYALPGTRLYVDLQRLDSKVIISMKNISREELNVEADELLERFVRGDASRNTEGSGLGLNIAQSLMELQKGQLQILVDGDLFKVTLIFPGA